MSFYSQILEEFNTFLIVKERLVKDQTLTLRDIYSITQNWVKAKEAEIETVMLFLDTIKKRYEMKTDSTPISTEEIKPIKETEILTVRELGDIAAQAAEYKLPYPPAPLVNKEMNQKFLKLINPEDYFDIAQFVYLRTITHPYKQTATIADLKYIMYLIEIEEWTQEMISYLISGQNIELYVTEIKYNREIDESLIQIIEKQIQKLAQALELNEEQGINKIHVSLTEEKLDLSFKIKENWIEPDLPLDKYKDLIANWGFMLKSKIMPGKLKIMNPGSEKTDDQTKIIKIKRDNIEKIQ
jgi:hypothetical protein